MCPLPLTHPLLGTWPATQACALTGNQTSDSLVHRPVLNPLSHTSQGRVLILKEKNLTQSFSFLNNVNINYKDNLIQKVTVI